MKGDLIIFKGVSFGESWGTFILVIRVSQIDP